MPYDPGSFGPDIVGAPAFQDRVHGYDPAATTDLAENFNVVHRVLIDNDVFIKQGLDQEGQSRAAADQAEADARAAADQALVAADQAEAGARAAADQALVAADQAEAGARAAEDQALVAADQAEAGARAAADGILQENITSESILRTNADVSIHGTISQIGTIRQNAGRNPNAFWIDLPAGFILQFGYQDSGPGTVGAVAVKLGLPWPNEFIDGGATDTGAGCFPLGVTAGGPPLAEPNDWIYVFFPKYAISQGDGSVFDRSTTTGTIGARWFAIGR
jgi:hypothetical protein